VDLGLFINGLPIATAEIKNELTGQTAKNAIRQYKTDRDKREKLFSPRRCLAHFAFDTSEVFVVSELANEKTLFLPFNCGKEGGAGNPDVGEKHKTAYLWEDIWSPESWSELIRDFVVVFRDVREKNIQVFPRFHQRKVVRKLAEDVVVSEAGKNYLIQHSAGSGKSMTIAWTAYRLAQLHNERSEKMFDSVFVITDRRDLDKQLRKTIETFEPVDGFLTSVREDHGAKTPQLTEAIENGAKVITTTIAVFPYVADVIGKFSSKRFAIIVDEAHSSQGGESSRAIHEVLQGEDTDEDFILKQLKNRQQGGNIHYFAFTATPKQETLERFGEKGEKGFVPFDLYSMRQAIEEGFIVDVLQNYTTYKQYFKILKKIPENPDLPRFRALSAIRRYIRNHPETIEQKVEIIVEHFHATIAPLLYEKAKAMIVTNSRESAVRYKLALDAYLIRKNYAYRSLVAFSDEVPLDGQSYTETGMNGVSESQTLEEFKKNDYKFLVVANKHQTGFDQPLLCGMYVDKKLSGVNAVQTLSRLNRVCKGKDRVFVLDFSNTSEEIKDAFDEYYTTTILSEGLDGNIINDTVGEIEDIYAIRDADLNTFSENLSAGEEKSVHRLVNSQLDVIVEDILWLDKEQVKDFRSKASFFTRLYPYAESVFGYGNERHERLYWFLKYLLKKIPWEKRQPLEIEDFLDAENIKVIRKEKERSVSLLDDESDIFEEVSIPGANGEDGQEDPLDEIIKKANEEWGVEFGKEQIKTLEKMRDEFLADERLRSTVEKNKRKKASVSVMFQDVFDGELHKQYDADRLLWETISANPELKTFVRSKMLASLFRETEKGRMEERLRV
jgi:type I restriction enzyme R subunit